MSKINPLILNLKSSYIFSEITKRVNRLKEIKPGVQIINLGIGDISLPLAKSIVTELKNAVDEMGTEGSVRGYGPELGYKFLREKLANKAFLPLIFSPDEIFISEGIATDLSSIRELFCPSCTIAICDPAYPAYKMTALLRVKPEQIVYLPCKEENGFVPELPTMHCDLIYLCSPSNPTGVALTKEQLQRFVNYAKKERALILFDAAYQPFVSSPDVPQSIFELEGATDVAIEFRSFSKGAGFTGLRCGYLTIPKTVLVWDGTSSYSLKELFAKTQETKTNGVSYPIQRAAFASLLPDGKAETAKQLATYFEATQLLRKGLIDLGYTVYGGTDAPYLFVKTPDGKSSWDFFDELLESYQITTVPGVGFGEFGEGFVRFSGFINSKTARKALERLSGALIK